MHRRDTPLEQRKSIIREDFLKEGTSKVSPERLSGTEQEKKGDSVQQVHSTKHKDRKPEKLQSQIRSLSAGQSPWTLSCGQWGAAKSF